MLVRFSVENFKSIREEQTLSMVASNYEKDLPGNVIELDVPGLKGVNLLKSAVIYGANASGKSNLLKAFDFMKDFVLTSAVKVKPANKTGIDTFILDKDWRHKPSKMEITLVLEDKIRVDYGFTITSDRVQEEWLTTYPKGRGIRLFHRWVEDGKDKYKFSKKVKIKKDLTDITRPDALFMTVARTWNVHEIGQIADWFQTELLDLNALAATGSTQATAYQDPDKKRKILGQLHSADFGIIDIDFGFLQSGPDKLLFTQFIHRLIDPENKSASISFNRDMESDGTNRFFDLIGPWLYILDNKYFGFIDEVDTSLHPSLVRKLIQTFHKWKTEGGQLLLTTHDTTLLSADLFRRDQIWITEKSYQGDTVLYPLSGFKVRKGESLQKGYLAGRYGGIPFLGPEIETDG